MNGKIIAKKLLNIEESISGVENNPEIQGYLNVFGYTPLRMKEGKELLSKVTNLMTMQVEEYNDQYLATNEFLKAWKRAYGKYMITLKVIRIAFFERPEILSRFNAIGRRNRSLSGWLRDSKIMYTNVLDTPEALDTMALYGYTTEQLNKELQDVMEIEQLHTKQLGEKGIAQQSTVERDEAFDALCRWYSKFRAIARVALYEKPQLLEALGITKK
jgi:hemoglobin-like flavoprotein